MNLDNFVKKYVIERDESMFAHDIAINSERLSQEIKGKSLLVIGGAGSIGSSFIKAVLKFEPSKLVIIDLNEN